ncbi:MAG: T9SS type A sorting domain-containing protein [Candidatus Aegiribacteria sp.]|nr:T9SS type A sorting domain-containing protein [Candidatus Aegiribacteria sp.]
MIILFIGLIAFTPARSIDAVAIDDTLFITMDRSIGDSYLFKYESSSIINEVPIGDYNNLSIGYFSESDTQCLIVISCNCYFFGDHILRDIIRRFDPEDLSVIWVSDSLPEIEGWMVESRPVYTERMSVEARQPRIVSYFCTHVTDASDELAIVSASFDPVVYPGCYDYLQYYSQGSGGYIDDDFFGPVAISGGSPLTVTANIWSYWWAEFLIRAEVHEEDTSGPPDWMRMIDVHFEVVYNPLPGLPCGFCLGSCANEAVFLWADSSGAIKSTTFSGDPLELTGIVPYEYPLVGFSGWIRAAASASCNPDDPGMLICYYRDGYIRARYREEGNWSPCEHLISPSGWIYNGNLAVCGVTDGYWITWNDGGDYPCIVFISRETLTSIAGEASRPLGPVSLTASPNPFVSSVTLTIDGNINPEDTIISVYDLSGHLIRALSPCAGESVLWNGCRSDGIECPAGTYIATIRSGDCYGSCSLVLIR